MESVNFEPPLVTELNAEPPPARYTVAGQPWDSAMEVKYFAPNTNTVSLGWGICLFMCVGLMFY